MKNDHPAAPITTVDLKCEFAKGKVVVRISFDAALRIHALAINP